MLRRVRDRWTHGGPSPVEAPAGSADVFVVSLGIETRGAAISVPPSPSAEDLAGALEACVHRDESDITGVDVTWQTSAPDGLHPLAPTTAGQRSCTFCGALFPAELVSCPGCGGPAR